MTTAAGPREAFSHLAGNGNSFSPEVRAIRNTCIVDLWNEGTPIAEIARRFRLGPTRVRQILRKATLSESEER